MTREIKFRCWDKISKEFEYFDIYDSLCGEELREFIEITQFTGLKDKNGKEIYEGDIVDLGMITPMEVKWLHHGFLAVNGQQESYSTNWDKSEVIGNIYENPKLISNKTT